MSVKFKFKLKQCNLLILLSILSLYPPLNMANNEDIINLPLTKLAWQETPEGVALTGDRFSESYMSMVRLPAGLISPPHTKSANMFGVMVSGEMIHHLVGEDLSEAITLPAGSFYKIPKNVPHISRCISEVECVTFLYQDGKFDFLPITE